jgi:folate-dependent phosphoribosylglycinamide formyltransferase PurN
MNPMKIISLGMMFYNLNKGLADDGKVIVDEGIDVLRTISAALKDQKVTNAEKAAIVKELREFTKVATGAIDRLVIPE